MRPQGPAHPLQPRGSFSSLLLATLHHLNKAGEWMVSVQAHVSQKVDGEVGRTSGTAGRMFRASVSSCPTMHVVYVRYVRQGDGTVHNLHWQKPSPSSKQFPAPPAPAHWPLPKTPDSQLGEPPERRVTSAASGERSATSALPQGVWVCGRRGVG